MQRQRGARPSTRPIADARAARSAGRVGRRRAPARADLPPADAGRPRGGARGGRAGSSGRAARCSLWPSRAGRRGSTARSPTAWQRVPLDREASGGRRDAPAGSCRSSRARSAGTVTGRTSFVTRSWPRGSSASISWAWRGSPLPSPISRSGWPRRRRGPSCSTRRGRSSGFRSFWASARTSWRRPATPPICAWLSGSLGFEVALEVRVVFENSAVWRSTGPLQVAAVDRRRVRPHPFRRGAETCRPSSAAALGRFTMGAPTFESRSGLAPAADSPSWSETGR